MRWIGSETFYFTRLAYQRAMALILLIAFLNAAFEFKPLLGEHGLLLPVPVQNRRRARIFRESPRDGLAQTPAGSGHHGDAIFDFQIHGV